MTAITNVKIGDSQYLTCRMQNCTETNRNKPFPGYIDPDSLIVQDDYVFVQLTSGGRPHYFVSYWRNAYAQMKLPKYALPKDMHVISRDENQVFAAVQEWNQNDTYNLYISDTRGVYFTLALENVQSSRGPEGNVMIDLYEVAGIKGMFLANKKIDNQVKTFITYNKGRGWRLLQAPDTDLRGDPVHCLLPYCSLHLHLKVSENHYTSGIIASRDTAPSIIVASGNIGSELSDSDISMFVSSDAGNTWRQIFEEEHSVLYLDQGGVLVAMKHTSLPIRHLCLSFDEGRSWSKYSFTSIPFFVDGVLGEPGEETLIMIVFGHFSHRSEWQLVKVDYKSIFDRRCAEEDYRPWQLHSQGEACIMGAKRIYKKRKSERKCMQGKYAGAMESEPCVCTELILTADTPPSDYMPPDEQLGQDNAQPMDTSNNMIPQIMPSISSRGALSQIKSFKDFLLVYGKVHQDHLGQVGAVEDQGLAKTKRGMIQDKGWSQQLKKKV
ncbi:VPS10 domain-containing receptor SorCS1-like [Callospermophilus lateralis]